MLIKLYKVSIPYVFLKKRHPHVLVSRTEAYLVFLSCRQSLSFRICQNLFISISFFWSIFDNGWLSDANTAYIYFFSHAWNTH